MPPKTTYTRKDIENAAFELFSKEGMQSVTVRRIASLLGSSTAPVYTSFGNMDEIRDAIMGRALNQLLSFTEKSYTKDSFLNIGVGMLIFARENRNLYRALFLEGNQYRAVLDRFTEQNLRQMRNMKSLSIFTDSELIAILDKMTVYTHGLAALLCAGMLQNVSDEWFIRTLQDTGEDIIGATAFKNGKAEYLNLGRECEDDENHAD